MRVDLTTMLFVPGDRPERVPNARASGARWVVVDLEDSVAASNKDDARSGLIAAAAVAARAGWARLAVRVNAFGSGHFDGDLAAVTEVWHELGLILLPMVPDAFTVRAVAAKMVETDRVEGTEQRGPRLVPMIETAEGVEAVVDIATSEQRICALAFGPADLSSQLRVRITPQGEELLYARSRLVMASAAAGLPGPLDGPWLNVDDDDGLRRSAAHARSLGFSGKLVIHPRQVDSVEEEFAPHAEELEWARHVIASFAEAEQRGVASIRLSDGTFVDYAIVSQARALLDSARRSST